jgi:hypothetical protein
MGLSSIQRAAGSRRMKKETEKRVVMWFGIAMYAVMLAAVIISAWHDYVTRLYYGF